MQLVRFCSGCPSTHGCQDAAGSWRDNSQREGCGQGRPLAHGVSTQPGFVMPEEKRSHGWVTRCRECGDGYVARLWVMP